MIVDDSRIEALLKCDTDLIRLSNVQLWKMQQSWRETFSSEIKRQTGKWIFLDKDWHAFSHGFTLCSNGLEAEMAYAEMQPEPVTLIASHEGSVGYSCSASLLPSAEDLKSFASSIYDSDLYLFPNSLRWTFVVVHEMEFGPYFAMAQVD